MSYNEACGKHFIFTPRTANYLQIDALSQNRKIDWCGFSKLAAASPDGRNFTFGNESLHTG